MIGVIIVTYNNEQDIFECLKSVFLSTYKHFKVMIIDNNSTDETVKLVKSKYPKVTIYPLKENMGFAAGNNFGIKKAISSRINNIFLLNPDTVIDKNCLAQLDKKNNHQTILQPLILIHDSKKKTNLVNTSGSILNFLGFSYCGNYREKSNLISNDNDIALASGAAMFVPVSIFKKIGVFDKKFFMYYEDADFSLRARIYGINIQIIPSAKIWHKYNFSRNKNKFYYTERNRLLFLFRNFSNKYFLLILPIFVINEILILIYSMITGWFYEKIKSYFSVVALLSAENKMRNKNYKKIIKQENNLKKYITSEISFSEIKSPLFTPYNVILKIYWRIVNEII
jgi:GT2 family glycosyltransferase